MRNCTNISILTTMNKICFFGLNSPQGWGFETPPQGTGKTDPPYKYFGPSPKTPGPLDMYGMGPALLVSFKTRWTKPLSVPYRSCSPCQSQRITFSNAQYEKGNGKKIIATLLPSMRKFYGTCVYRNVLNFVHLVPVQSEQLMAVTVDERAHWREGASCDVTKQEQTLFKDLRRWKYKEEKRDQANNRGNYQYNKKINGGEENLLETLDPTPKRNLIRKWRIPPRREIWLGSDRSHPEEKSGQRARDPTPKEI